MNKQFQVVGLAFVLLLAACGPQAPAGPSSAAREASQPAGPKRITAAIHSSPAYIGDKVFAGAGGYPGINHVEAMVNAGVATLDNRDVLQPQLAETLPTTENGLWRVLPDGRMETTWKLRDGIRWQDGVPFSSTDLVFTATVEQDPELLIPPAVSRFYRFVESVEAPDPRTVVVQWRRPFIDADRMFASPLPRHLLERTYLADKARFAELPYWGEQFVGTGAFKLREFVRDSHLVLEANADYVLGRPKIDEVTVRFIPDSNTMAANVLAGEVELTLGRGLSLNEGVQLRDQWRNGKLEIAFAGWYAMYAQSIDPSPPMLADVRFRRAVVHAIDRQQLADALQAGLVPPAHSYVAPSAPEYARVESSIMRYDYDVRRTAQLLEELGYSRGPDGYFRDAAGQRLALEVRSANEPDVDANSNVAVRDYLERAGISVESELYGRQRGRDLEYRATYPGFQLQRQPNTMDALIRYHSSQVALPATNWAGENKGRYGNPEMDTLIDRFYSTIPQGERMQALGQITRHMTERLHVLGLFYDGESGMIGNRIQNVFANNPGWNAHLWEVAS